MKKAATTQIIRVAYPAKDRRLILRTDQNWDRDIEAQSVDPKRSIWEFAVETDQPFFYFKPLLARDDVKQWSKGDNFLAVATSGTPLEIHPYFLEDGQCSVCELMRPLASPAGMEHRFRVFR